MLSIVDKNGTIFSADSVEKVIELYRAFHSECNDGGWITWNGGECPIYGESRVEYRTRCDEVSKAYAESLRWSHLGYPGDIVAYKVVKNA